MAEVGLAFLSASLSVLFDRIASPEVVDFMQGRKLTVRLSRKLKTAMQSVNAVLADAEEKQLTNPLVKEWVDELKDVLFDAEDILDEIATETLRRKLDAESSTTAEKVLDCISNTFLDTFVNEVEPKIEEVLDRLEDLTKQKDCMGLHEVVGVGGKQYPERLPTSYVSESDTFGRDEDKKKVIDLLLPSDAEANERCVIAIVGMGGIGKTTLAKLVYNESRVKQHFDLKIWFCVSEEFDVLKIKKSIIAQVATSSTGHYIEDPEQLRVTLEENLNGKKFLLVLDDVWSEKPIHQEFLSQLLHYGTRGSKILVTTRNDSVALVMHAEPHHLKLLPKDACWSLFEKHAFRNGSSNADPKIKEIGTQIVEKCKGLPLAIKAIGDLLGSKSDHVERYWTTILKSNLWDVPMEKTNIIPALRLSYKYLPSNLKRCFAYCSIFPKGYLFQIDKLVLLWMAEGFLQQSEIETMEEVGNGYFHDLVSRSLFQQSSRVTKSCFVMHDLVNDLAKFETGQFGFTMEVDSSKEIGKMTRYSSYFKGSFFDSKKIEMQLFKAKQLRTLLTLNSSMGSASFKLPIDEFKKNEEDLFVPLDSSTSLRVLSVSGRSWGMIIKSFDFSKIKHLRYLSFSHTYINSLPDSICMLCNLQTLKLSYCENLDKWPRDMWKLINLRHLEFDYTSKIKEMPIRMGRLEYLQTLTNFVTSKHDSGSRIGELEKLKNLRGSLSILELQNVTLAQDALDASLKMKGYLEELKLIWNPKKEFGISESQRGVLENLEPHENLKRLNISYYYGNNFPDWIGGLPSLSTLKLGNCKYCSALPPLGQLPSLNDLYIVWLDGVVIVGGEFYGNSSNSSIKPFGSLKFLRLEKMSNWDIWLHYGGENEVETFSQLKKLYIVNCPKLRAKLPVHPPSLVKLEITNCKLELPMHQQYSSLEELFLTNCCDSLASISLDIFPSMKHIRIEGCNNLKSLEQHGDHLEISSIRIWKCPKFVDFPKGGLRAPNLAEFKLSNCESLRSMPDKMHIFLPSLRSLELVDCPEVETFPEGGLPSNLKQIVIKGCDNLKSLEQHGNHLDISSIRIWKCPKFVDFPKGGLHAPNLAKFELCNCESLRLMPDKMHIFLLSLRSLELVDCPEVESFPEGGLPSNLKQIVIKRCKKLIANWKGWGLQILHSLEWLEIDNDKSKDHVEFFPGELLLPTNLTHLSIFSFEKLKSLNKEGFQHLTSLVQLKIRYCSKLKYMPEEGFPASLRILDIWNCDPVLLQELERKEREEWLKVAHVPNIMIHGRLIQGDERFPDRVDLYEEMNYINFSPS